MEVTRRAALVAAIAAALLGDTVTALAQFSGQLPNNTVLGNTSGATAPARPVPIDSGFGALGANPTAVASGAAINGSATTYMRSDAAPAITFTQRLAIGWDPALDPATNVIATLDQASTLVSLVGTVVVPVGAAATLSVHKAASGAACSAGTVLHSGTFDANGTAVTNQTLTVTVTALSAGDRLCLITSDSANWIAGVGVGGITARITTP